MRSVSWPAWLFVLVPAVFLIILYIQTKQPPTRAEAQLFPFGLPHQQHGGPGRGPGM